MNTGQKKRTHVQGGLGSSVCHVLIRQRRHMRCFQAILCTTDGSQARGDVDDLRACMQAPVIALQDGTCSRPNVRSQQTCFFPPFMSGRKACVVSRGPSMFVV